MARRRSTTRARCLPTQTRPRAGQLVLGPPEEPDLRRPLHEAALGVPTAQLPASPSTCSQSEGSTTSAFGKSSASPTLSTHFAACGTVRTTLSSLHGSADREALSRAALRPRRRRPARRAGRAALRRDLRRAAPRLPRAQSLQRRPPDACPTPRSRRPRDFAAWRTQRRARTGATSATGGSRRTTPARRCRAHA